MNTLATFKLIWVSVVTDKTLKAGVPIGLLTTWSGVELAKAKEAIAIYATAAGALLTTLMIVLTLIKIVKALRSKGEVE